jgi:small subunit ribosomal protein S17
MSDPLHRTTRTGRSVSDKMDKTVVVMIEKKVMHPVYKKFITRRTKYKAHDELNAFQMDDVVEIEETRPLSRDKRWRVKRLIERIA